MACTVKVFQSRLVTACFLRVPGFDSWGDYQGVGFGGIGLPVARWSYRSLLPRRPLVSNFDFLAVRGAGLMLASRL